MHSHRRLLETTLGLICFLTAAASAAAMLPGDPEAVSVGLRGKINTGAGTVTIGATTENGYRSVTATGSGNQTNAQTLSMVPGKGYDFVTTFSNLSQFEFFLAPPAGYEVVFGQVKSDGVRHTVQSGQTTYTYRAFLQSTQFLPAGQSSDLGVGRIRWSLGLGNLRNGDPAGVIQLREDDALTPLGLGNVIVESGNPQVDRIDVSATHRQVLAPQTLVDISESAGELYLKCYSYAALDYFDGTKWVTLAGHQPFVEYTIDRPAGGSNPALRITRTNRLGGTRTDWTHMQQFGASWHIIPWTDSAVSWPNWSTSRMWATDAAQTHRYITWQRQDGTTQAQDFQLYNTSGQLLQRQEGVGQP